MKRAVVIAALVVALGCGASYEQLQARELCYERAEAEAQARVDVECRDLPFAECPFSDDIMADLQRDQEACK